MKSPSLLLKVLVLTGFFGAIAALVAYRTGRLDGLLYSQAYSSGGAFADGVQAFPVDTPRKDSLVRVDSFYLDENMGSSKSFILYDAKEMDPPRDTAKKDSALRMREFMGSSKSGRMIEFKPIDTSRIPGKKP